MQKSETKTGKRILACIMVVVMVLAAIPLGGLADPGLGMTASAEDLTEGYYSYTVSNKKATITDCELSIRGNVAIPDTFGGYPLTRIYDSAFEDCAGLTSITIPDSVTSIGESAFQGCTGLTSITLPDSITDIPDGVFYGCTGLTNITLPDSIVHISDMAFSRCTGLTSITLPDSVSWIGSWVFADCTNLASITISDSLKIIGYGIFSGCTGLKDVYYAGTKTQWENIAFNDDGTTIGECEAEYGESFLTDATIHYNYKPHTHTYTSSVTKATMSADGKIVTACTICGIVSKTTPIYKVSSIKLSTTSYAYNGKVQTPTVTVKDSKGKTLVKNTDYTVTYPSGRKNIGRYSMKVTLKGKYSGAKTLYFDIIPAQVSKPKATQTTSSVTLSWSKIFGSNMRYYVFSYNPSTKKYKSLGYTTGTSFTVKKLSAGTTYYYAVQAYNTTAKRWGKVSPVLTTATKPGTPSLTVTAGTKKASLKWNKQTGATGYVVYMATSKNGKYSKIATLKGNSAVSYTKTGLTAGKTYYFKVAAYKTIGSSNLYGSFSAVKAVKVK